MDEDVAAEIGARLKEERVRLGLNQTEFGDLCKVHRMTQVKYESGERNFDSLYLRRMLDRTSVDVLYIMTGQRGFEPKPQYTADEVGVIRLWRGATADTKAVALRVLRS